MDGYVCEWTFQKGFKCTICKGGQFLEIKLLISEGLNIEWMIDKLSATANRKCIRITSFDHVFKFD